MGHITVPKFRIVETFFSSVVISMRKCYPNNLATKSFLHFSSQPFSSATHVTQRRSQTVSYVLGSLDTDNPYWPRGLSVCPSVCLSVCLSDICWCWPSGLSVWHLQKLSESEAPILLDDPPAMSVLDLFRTSTLRWRTFIILYQW